MLITRGSHWSGADYARISVLNTIIMILNTPLKVQYVYVWGFGERMIKSYAVAIVYNICSVSDLPQQKTGARGEEQGATSRATVPPAPLGGSTATARSFPMLHLLSFSIGLLAAVSSAGDPLGCDRAGDRCPLWAVLATDRAGDPFVPGETSAD